MDLIPGPNLVVPTAPSGDSSNKPASTQFVTQAIATIPTPPTGVSTTQVDFISGGIKAPQNQSYDIIEYVPFSITLTNFVGKLSGGTMTAYLSINAATVTGGTLNLSSAQSSSVPSALNTAAAGSTLVLTVSSVTSPTDFSFMVQFNRSLATG